MFLAMCIADFKTSELYCSDSINARLGSIAEQIFCKSYSIMKIERLQIGFVLQNIHGNINDNVLNSLSTIECIISIIGFAVAVIFQLISPYVE